MVLRDVPQQECQPLMLACMETHGLDMNGIIIEIKLPPDTSKPEIIKLFGLRKVQIDLRDRHFQA